jgi:hypothetical protein
MYTCNTIPDMITSIEHIVSNPIERQGVLVYVDADPDFASADFQIDPADTKGLEIFRQFCRDMAEHYKHLNKKP